MLRCRSLDDATVQLDSALRRVARVSYVSRSQHDGSAADLVRHFVRGEERYVCVVDVAARVSVGWERGLTPAPGECVSVPVPRERGQAAFPTLRADGSRGGPRVFAHPSRALVPSVAWCAELSVAPPATWRRWCDDGHAPAHRVPDFAVLEPFDPQGNDAPPTSRAEDAKTCERVGLTPHADDAEKISKYGSTRAARLAADFAREEKTQS